MRRMRKSLTTMRLGNQKLVLQGQRLPEAWCGLGLLGLCRDESALALLHWSLWLAPLQADLVPAVFSLARDAVLEVTIGGSSSSSAQVEMALRRLDVCGARLALHGLAGHLAVFHPQHLADFARFASGWFWYLFIYLLCSFLAACLPAFANSPIPIAPRAKFVPRRGVKNGR